MKSLVLFSGPVAVGKSAVASVLIENHGFARIRSGPYLQELATQLGKGHSRAELQGLGNELDVETDYRWLIDQVAASAIFANPDRELWLLDSVRKERQVLHFRDRYGPRLLHLHFTAPEKVLRARYEQRMALGGEYAGNTPYSTASKHPNEQSARALSASADCVIDLHQTSPDEAANAIAEQCRGRR